MVKVIEDPTRVDMFANTGIGQWFRYGVGALELAGAVGVMIPPLSGLAALGLVCQMVGATLTNLFVLGTNPLFTVSLLMVSARAAWSSWTKTTALRGRIRR